MSRLDQIRANYVNQSRGLLRVARDQSSNAIDFGLVGAYNNGAVAGLIRHAADGNFYLFDSLTTSPFTADVVSIASASFNAATLVVGAINATTISNKGTLISTSTVLVGNEANYHSVNTISGNVICTLPPLSYILNRYIGSPNGMELTFVKKDSSANTLTITTASGDLLDGVAANTIVLTQQFEMIRLIFIGDTDVGWLQC